MPEIFPIDAVSVFYAAGGAAFFGLTFLPILKQSRYVSVPTIYVVAGTLLALSPLALPFVDPRRGGMELTVIERASELIVIVSLAGAGLAVDRPMGLKSWQSTWRLLGIAMPITIAGIALMALYLVGLPLATAVLLGAALAPTDPVLARSVQVDRPGSDEHEVQVALTAEAGLNDGLAFPFVYLAIAFAALGAEAELSTFLDSGKAWSWLGMDLFYRIAAGIVIGILVGYGLSTVVYSPIGDAEQERSNAGLTLMGLTFLSYGLTEAVEGYGFLAVFVAARAARRYARRRGKHGYEEQPHHFADQVEGLLMALLLLWFGALLTTGVLSEARPVEWLVAALLVFVLRPLAGLLSLAGPGWRPIERVTIAFFGIRGMGSIFYLAYGQNHGSFGGVDVAWRLAALVILISVVVHGATSALMIGRARSKDGLEPRGG